MIRYILKRLMLAAATLAVILLVSYLMLRLAPGDPADSNLFGGDAGVSQLASDRTALTPNRALREKLHLDKSPAEGFMLWAKDALRGDFGTSAVVDPGRRVTEIIMERLPVTVKLNLLALLVTCAVAVPSGVYSAVKQGKIFDRGSATLFFVLYSLPVMWAGLMLQAAFCEGGKWAVFPLKGIGFDDDGTMSVWRYQLEILRHFFLPVLCMCYAGFASLSRYTRNGMLDALGADYIRTARACGVGEGRIVWVHAFRNALITLITLLSGMLPGLAAGSVLVEYIFNIPGMGSLALLSLSCRDYPLQMALFTFTGALTLAGILIADLLYPLADPRIKFTGK